MMEALSVNRMSSLAKNCGYRFESMQLSGSRQPRRRNAEMAMPSENTQYRHHSGLEDHRPLRKSWDGLSGTCHHCRPTRINNRAVGRPVVVTFSPIGQRQRYTLAVVAETCPFSCQRVPHVTRVTALSPAVMYKDPAEMASL